MTAVTITTTFYTCIIIKIGIFGSEIIAEKHFRTLEQAEKFAEKMESCGAIAVVAEV